MKKNKWNLSKSQRMQIKALSCLLGIVLLVILLIGRLIFVLVKPKEPEEEIHIPVVTYLENVWIMEVDKEGLLIFQDGVEEAYPFDLSDPVPESAREQVADITLTDGYVTEVTVKNDKISGKVLTASSAAIELEGIGKFTVSETVKGYRLYDEIMMCTISDVTIGYNFCDFVLNNGEICAILVCKEEAMENIRVLLKASDYNGIYHDSISLTGDSGYIIRYGTYDNMAEEIHEAGEELVISSDSTYFQSDRVYIASTILTGKLTLKNVSRSQGTPSYRGALELVKTDNGLIVVNELLLEEYLYSVVPSEMPASYPEEALKAQAVCARTYAYSHMLKAGYPQYGAHVDDSTSYQVYNNILEHEATTKAAKATFGQLLYTENDILAGTYYYSTSCGLGSDINVWKSGNVEGMDYLKAREISISSMESVLSVENGEEDTGDSNLIGEAMKTEETFAAHIQSVNEDDFEKDEGWYRWTYTVSAIDEEYMLAVIQKRYDANSKLVLTLGSNGAYTSKPVQDLGDILEISIISRGSGGVADELLIEAENNTIKIISEHNIRYVLNDGISKVLRQDGSNIASANILPSGFFLINPVKEKGIVTGYSLIGGGYGHGVGMSQNGARAMANNGYSAEEILIFFYENCMIKTVYTEAEDS